MIKRYKWFVALPIAVFPAMSAVMADDTEPKVIQRETLYITGGAEAIKQQPGSAHLIDEQALEKFEYDDINRVLSQVPGVNIQEEEGYGLRPNIGLRGTQPHRSRKLALMEDAILIGPAPYSAPAAYYFPMFAKMEGIEVFKGPASIQHGPNTVGGAVNLVTRSVPEQDKGRVTLAYGEDNYHKAHVYYGQRSDNWGWLVDGIQLGSDGFKELDTGDDTGFSKSDITMKGLWTSDFNSDKYQELELKLQYSDEDSNSSYTGLSDQDFQINPYRRYAASERDNMSARHKQTMLTHRIDWTPTLAFTSIAYHNQFERTWSKLNGFDNGSSGPSIRDVLADPNANPEYLDILRGDENSDILGFGLGKLLIGNNARRYSSSGVQFLAHWDPVLFGVPHEFEFGLRHHHDWIKRNHTEDRFDMVDGELVRDSSARATNTVNKDSTDATALHVHDKIFVDDWTFTIGSRIEHIESERRDDLAARQIQSNEYTVVIPGAGVYYQVNTELGVLAGINKGFSPVGPGQDDGIKPEESINYEFGFRYYAGPSSVEWVGFYNDYSNIKSICTFSSNCSDAELDEEFNGGAAEVIGFEFSLGHTVQGERLSFPMKLDYTYTDASFGSTFTSESQDWGIGEIREGDALPYIPEHQFTVSAGIVDNAWALHSIVKYVGERSDSANDEVSPSNREISSHAVLDLKGSYNWSKDLKTFVTIKNALDKVYYTSYRPFGAMAGIPRQIQAGLKYSF